MFTRQTIQLTSLGKPVTIHLVSCGAVAVKNRFRKSRFSGIAAMGDFIFDSQFTEWLPIWVMIIEHPEGIFVIDTGEVSAVNNKDYFKSSGFLANWFDKSQFKFIVNRDDEIDRQLQALNIPISNVRKVVLTHLHFDHTDGIQYFPTTEIVVSKFEYEKPFGDLPKLYPPWFKPTLLELNESYDVFDKVYPLTSTKDVTLIQTPGHTYGHCSVLIKADDIFILFAADICYSQQQLIEETFPGNNAGNKLAKETYKKVKAFARNHPTVFIPSHEIEAGSRLKELKALQL